tara:strand:+ start:745 stop:1122 length:378 start_codon:yes stop_codon:yes gene_type:complete
MSKVDTVFGSIPGPIISEWGQSMVFIRNSGEGTYNQTTGVISTTETRITVKAVITKVSPSEMNGSLQTTDVKIMIDAAQLGSTYVTTADQFEYTEDTDTITANIIQVDTARGDSPIFYTCFARPQ